MKRVIVYILIAFIFSVGLRFSYISNIKNNSEFKYNSEYIINTNDGYLFAQGAKEILSYKYNNIDRANFDHSAIDRGLSKVTVFLMKITGAKIETIIFYLSAFLSSLVVVPIILIGWTVGSLELGFVAALFGSIAWSYYNRTMLGYYDTDMLNIVFPAFLLWSLIAAIKTKKSIYFLITALEIIAYRWWYPKSYSIEFSLIAMTALYFVTLNYFKLDYLLDLKNRLKNDALESAKVFYLSLVIFMLFGINNLPDILRLIIVIALYFFYTKKSEVYKQYIWYIFGLAIIIFLVTGGLNPIIWQLKGYVFKNDVASINDSLSLHYFSVVKTISEASAIPLTTVANRISGSMVVFVLSIIGFVMLLVRHRYFILSLPLIGLGLLAYSSGLRFTIYAIVPLAFGIAYLIVFIANFIKDSTNSKAIYYGVVAVLTIAVLYPNVKHMLNYNKYIRPVFIKSEIKTLDALKSKVSKKDYILSWWDYGYPLKFYSELNTLVDGGIHSGSDNFPVSYILTKPQEKAAKMARLAVEYHEKRFNLIMKEKDKSDDEKTKINDIEYMILDNGYKSANKFLSEIENIKLPKKTRDIYLYLPDRMMRIFPVVEQFSNMDIESGKSYPRSFFITFRNYKKVGDKIYFPYKYSFDLKRGIFHFRGQDVPVNKFIVTGYKGNKLIKSESVYNISSEINIIYQKSSGRFVVLEDKMLNSTYIQLFVLENYDKNLYQPVVLTPLVKIYKLKI